MTSFAYQKQKKRIFNVYTNSIKEGCVIMVQQTYIEAITEYNDIMCGIKKRFSKDVNLN